MVSTSWIHIQSWRIVNPEMDSNRLKFYFYMNRNHAHTFMADSHNGNMDKRHYREKQLRLIKDLLKSHNYQQAKIVIKALWALRMFKPQIQFPKVDTNS